MKNDFQYATKKDVAIVAAILVVTFVALFLTGCQTGAPQSPPPMEPEDDVAPAAPVAAETPEEVFTREFDECWTTWKECLKTKPDSVCFPVHEACAIKAYRKLVKAREQQT